MRSAVRQTSRRSIRPPNDKGDRWRLFDSWFTEDFTLEELRTLRAKERLPHRSHAYDGQSPSTTIAECWHWQIARARRGVLWVCIRDEAPDVFPRHRFGAGRTATRALARMIGIGVTRQFSFSRSKRRSARLRTQTRVRLVQLVSDPGQVTPAALREIATYADGIGANTVSSSRRYQVQPRRQSFGTLMRLGCSCTCGRCGANRSFWQRATRETAGRSARARRVRRRRMFSDFPDLVLAGLGRR